MCFKIFVIFCLILGKFECARILAVYPSVSQSHVIPLQSLTLVLAEKGHDITFFSPYPLKQKVKNYRDIQVPIDQDSKNFISDITKNPNSFSIVSTIPTMVSLLYQTMNDTMQMKEMRKIMDEESFDLVIVGYSFSEAMTGLADHFKCPSIIFSPFGTMAMLNQIVGSPLGTSGTPHKMLPVDNMNFINRLKNFLYTGIELGMTQYLKYRSRKIYEYKKPCQLW